MKILTLFCVWLIITDTYASFIQADVLILKDGTPLSGNLQGLLSGMSSTVLLPDGRTITLNDSSTSHVGVKLDEIRSSFRQDDFSYGSTFSDDQFFVGVRSVQVVNTGETGKRKLQIGLLVRNLNERRYLQVVGQPKSTSDSYEYLLRDDARNEVRREAQRVSKKAHPNLSDLDRISPEAARFTLLTFETPLPKTRYLVLDISSDMFQVGAQRTHSGALRLLIPKDQVSFPEKRVETARRSIEKFARTSSKADGEAVMGLIDGLDEYDDKSFRRHFDRQFLMLSERAVSQLEMSPESTNRKVIDKVLTEAARSIDDNVQNQVAELRKRVATAELTYLIATVNGKNIETSLKTFSASESTANNAELTARTRAALGNGLLLRSKQHVETGKIEEAIADFEKAEAFGAVTSALADARLALVDALITRFNHSINVTAYDKAASEYEWISRLDPAAANRLSIAIAASRPAVLENLPAEILATLNSQTLAKLPTTVLVKLSPAALQKLPPAVLMTLPPQTNSIGMKFKFLPAGQLAIQRDVSLSQAFEIGVHEVTQQQFMQLMGENPSRFKGPSHPAESVTWNAAAAFCRKLSQLVNEETAGYIYRLPTEAEWEYACRAGTETTFSFGDNEVRLEKFAWHDANARKKTHPVGKLFPNGWGLYDMHGNVWEWCADWHGEYLNDPLTDPIGPATGTYRVCKGGSFGFTAWSCRSSNRYGNTPDSKIADLGFRVVRHFVK